jgi:hypothetical protein
MYSFRNISCKEITDSHLVKKFCGFCGTWKFVFCVHKNLSVFAVLSQINPVHILISYLFDIHYNIILPLYLGLFMAMLKLLKFDYFGFDVSQIFMQT